MNAFASLAPRRSRCYVVPVSCCLAGFLMLGVLLGAGQATAASSPDERSATKTTLDYGLALGALQVRDDLLRPLRWSGGQGAIVVGLEVDRGPLLHRAGIEVGAGILRDRYGDGGMVVTQSAHYACLARLRSGRRVQVLVGATYRYESIDAYYYDWDDSFLYWMTSHALSTTTHASTCSGPSASTASTGCTIEMVWPTEPTASFLLRATFCASARRRCGPSATKPLPWSRLHGSTTPPPSK